MAIAKNKKNGKWYCKFYFHDYTGKRLQKKKEGFAKKADAQKWQDEFLAMNEGQEHLTFQQAYNRYIEDCKVRLKPSSWHTIKSEFKHFDSFKDIRLTNITPGMIREWQNKYLLRLDPETGKMVFSRTTAQSANTRLSTFFNYCVRFLGLPRNPVQAAGRIKFRAAVEKVRQEKHFWTQADFEKFLAVVDDPAYRLSYKVLFWLGLRRGEMLGLRRKDVDVENNIIHIRNNRTNYSNSETPKTASSVRDVLVLPALMAEIEDYLKHIYKGGDALLFPFSLSDVWKKFRQWQRKAGIEPIIRLHDLRHSAASMMINMGFTPAVVGDRLGHNGPEMVERIYGHLYEERRTEVAEALNKAFLKEKSDES